MLARRTPTYNSSDERFINFETPLYSYHFISLQKRKPHEHIFHGRALCCEIYRDMEMNIFSQFVVLRRPGFWKSSEKYVDNRLLYFIQHFKSFHQKLALRLACWHYILFYLEKSNSKSIILHASFLVAPPTSIWSTPSISSSSGMFISLFFWSWYYCRLKTFIGIIRNAIAIYVPPV